MREVRTKFEYIINCECTKQWAYDKYDMTKQMRCPACGTIHQFDGSHDTYILEKIKVYEYNAPLKELTVDE